MAYNTDKCNEDNLWYMDRFDTFWLANIKVFLRQLTFCRHDIVAIHYPLYLIRTLSILKQSGKNQRGIKNAKQASEIQINQYTHIYSHYAIITTYLLRIKIRNG